MRDDGPMFCAGHMFGSNISRYVLQIFFIRREKQALRLIVILRCAHFKIFVMVLNGVFVNKFILAHT